MQTCLTCFGLADVPGSTFLMATKTWYYSKTWESHTLGKVLLEEPPSDSVPDNPRELITTSPWGATHASFEGRNAELSGRF